MNVVYSSDDNYVQHMAVSILSLLKTNVSADAINLFIISNNISETSKELIDTLVSEYSRSVFWIDFKPFSEQLTLDMEWPISLSSYARLFMADILPDWCERAIYLDCDTIVCRDLAPLWASDMKNCPVAGVKDLVIGNFKKSIGLGSDDMYINAGILLADLALWRKLHLQNQFLAFIRARNGKVIHHDQGVINGTLRGKIHPISPEYNSMTPYFTRTYRYLTQFYELRDYYSEAEVQTAVSNPAIIHFTPEFVGRVWEYECSHPKAALYRNLLDETPWCGHMVHAAPLPMKLKLLYWMYQYVPVPIQKALLRLR